MVQSELVVVDQTTGLIVTDNAPIMRLREVETFLATRPPIEHAKELRDRLAGYAEYYHNDVARYNEVYAGQIRTERYIGQMLAEVPRAAVGRPEKNGNTMLPFPAPTLDDLGFTKMQSSRLQQLAAVPEERVTAYIEAQQQAVARIVKADIIEYTEEATIARSPRFNDGMKSTDTVEWYTPAAVYTRVRGVFGGAIDTDPCSCASAQERIQAQRYYTIADDGLDQPWEGNTFVNPPYGDEIKPWIPRTVEAYESGECRSIIMLVPGRTETDWFTPLLHYPICIVHGRLTFWNPTKPDKPAPFPSIVVYLGHELTTFRDWFSDIGPIYVPL